MEHDWLLPRLTLIPALPRGNLFLHALTPSRRMARYELVEIKLWLQTELAPEAWWVPRDERHIAFRREEDLRRFLTWFEKAELLPAPYWL